jgi:hypothetical protein
MRSWLGFCAFLAVAFAMAITGARNWPDYRTFRERCDEVKIGMTQSQVERLLGYREGELTPVQRCPHIKDKNIFTYYHERKSGAGEGIDIRYDDSRRVIRKSSCRDIPNG